jgi:hypothetical protein
MIKLKFVYNMKISRNKLNFIFVKDILSLKIKRLKWTCIYQSLVGSVVIAVELGREDHGSIPRNFDREGAGTT